MASDIFSGITFTCDCPSSNVNGKMPVLDLQLWLEKDESGVGVVRFEYYEKPIASKVVIHKKSAISWTVKRSTLVSEVYRRLYNCDPQVEWQERTEYVNHLVIKMWRSGYSKTDIKCFVKGGVGRYEKMLERVNTGERPLYRDSSFQRVERWKKRVTNRMMWSESKSVVFIPLSQRLKEEAVLGVKRIRENIKVVEKRGTAIKEILQRSDPAKDHMCKDPDCWICSVQHGGQKGCIKGGCNLRGVGYVITCIDCQNNGLDRRYEGETGCEARKRASQHLQDLRAKKLTSGLYRHTLEAHGGVQPVFRFQVRECFTDPLTRQVEEGARIEGEEEEILFNTKQEWQPPLLSRLVVD